MSPERAPYAPGARVRIVNLDKPGHVRTPMYVREQVGIVERYCGDFENPEERAYGRVGRPRIRLYRVRFNQHDLWPDYDGPESDTLEIEIYDHWLRPAGPGETA
ncbi:MAG TPA: SH3-like domain-containing protein [Xanthobacteraceae bacterium]|nr:SH3-like domain-containing protein [Xanthobacteraceae bacterium]